MTLDDAKSVLANCTREVLRDEPYCRSARTVVRRMVPEERVEQARGEERNRVLALIETGIALTEAAHAVCLDGLREVVRRIREDS